MAEYDTISKQLIRIYPQDLIRLALGREDFDPAVAGQFAGRIAVINDLQRLKQLHRVAVQVDDLAAFQRVLDADA